MFQSYLYKTIQNYSLLLKCNSPEDSPTNFQTRNTRERTDTFWRCFGGVP